MFEIRYNGLPEVLKNVRTRPLFVMHLQVRPLVIVGERQAYCIGRGRGIDLRSVRASRAARARRRGEPACDCRRLEGPHGMIQEPDSEVTLDTRLDEALEMTFPASDPIAVHSSDPRPTRPPHTEESSSRGPVNAA
jgi:hypothetical protein